MNFFKKKKPCDNSDATESENSPVEEDITPTESECENVPSDSDDSETTESSPSVDAPDGATDESGNEPDTPTPDNSSKKSERKNKKSKKSVAKGPLKNDKLWYYMVLSAIIVLIVECLSRRSILEGIKFIFVAPFPFFVNCLIVFALFAIATFCPKRFFSIGFFSALVIGIAVANCVLMGFRVTPLSPIDFYIFFNIISIIDVYLTIPEIILYISLIVGAIIALIIICIKTPAFKTSWKRSLVTFVSTIAIFAISFLFGIKTNLLTTELPNLYNAYNKYGFVYCFSLALADQGIDKPDDYSNDEIDEIVSIIGDEPSLPEKTPNVIFVQLESFFDVNFIDGVSYTENPIPNYTALKEKYENGLLRVPTIGAGTVNTEFEILTGMSLAYFGAGEYPYKSILSTTCSESMAYNLKEIGYSAFALHNHEGSFYSRNDVYSMLGFDTFISIEYMNNTERNENDWAKDTMLTEHIFKALESTEGDDFIFTVSVQPHGKYPTNTSVKYPISVSSGIDDASLKAQFDYFINQAHETDIFISELTEAVMNFDEDTVLVFYGDHLPSLSITEESLKKGDLFTTEYIIISNYENTDEEKNTEHKTLSAYELSAHVFKKIGITNGYVNRLHQTVTDTETKENYLEKLMYDMLYGDRYIYGGNEEYYSPSSLKMGLEAPRITGAYYENGKLIVKGKNFNEFSEILVNGKHQFSGTTVYKDSSTLEISISSKTNVEYVAISQISATGIELSVSDRYYTAIKP